MVYQTRPMEEADWAQVKRIYQAGIDTGIATFSPVVPDYADWNRSHRKDCRLVATISGGTIVGWVALSPTSGKEAYQGVAEVSIYVDPVYSNQGAGRFLLEDLMMQSEAAGYWTLQSLIILENEKSLSLHKKCGFRVVGVRERPAKIEKTGRWHDVVLMERRSTICGVF